MDIPVLELPTVFHLGTLQPQHRGGLHATSLEGAGLSVSLCPLAWQRIARLGGAPLQQLDCPGALFLDLRGLDADMQAAVADWAVAAGLAEHATRWTAWAYDDESERWGATLHPTRAAALEQAAYDLGVPDDEEPDLDVAEADGGPPGGCLVGRMAILALTEAGKSRALGYPGDEAADIAAMFYVEDVLRPASPELVGVWWRDEYDPMAWRAPRGAILPGCLGGFQAVETSFGHIADDEELLEAMPGPQLLALAPAGPAPC